MPRKKKFHVVWYLRPFCIVLEVSSAGTFENFSRCFAVFFFWFFLLLFFVFFFSNFFFVLFCFVFFFCATWKVVCLQFRMFFFLNFLLEGLLYSGCSSFTCSGFTNVVFKGFFASRSPMWFLKVFCVEVTNVGFKGFYEVSG